MSISPAGVHSIGPRHDLTPMKLRLKALETRAAHELPVLIIGVSLYSVYAEDEPSADIGVYKTASVCFS